MTRFSPCKSRAPSVAVLYDDTTTVDDDPLASTSRASSEIENQSRINTVQQLKARQLARKMVLSKFSFDPSVIPGPELECFSNNLAGIPSDELQAFSFESSAVPGDELMMFASNTRALPCNELLPLVLREIPAMTLPVESTAAETEEVSRLRVLLEPKKHMLDRLETERVEMYQRSLLAKQRVAGRLAAMSLQGSAPWLASVLESKARLVGVLEAKLACAPKDALLPGRYGDVLGQKQRVVQLLESKS
jgi:hypothetical protein